MWCYRGLRLRPNHTLDDCPPLDTLTVPGGGGVRSEIENSSDCTVQVWDASPADLR